jgi:two-component system, OmpR family, sensor kinase
VRAWLAPLQWLRLRAPATAMAIFALSLAVALVLAYELLLQDGRRDIDVVMAREQDRFQQSMEELLDEELTENPEAEPVAALQTAVERYLSLNPATESYWTIVTFEGDRGRRFASRTGPPELMPLLQAGDLPSGELNKREPLDTPAGEIRSSTVPIMLGGEQVATLQIVSPMAPVRAEALESTRLLGAAAGLTLVLGGILLAASLWRSLTPLTHLARAARSTELRALDARVEVPDTEDEVGTLAREFNTMLDRLDAAAASQREFMASIGHELRTPITIARGHLELLRTTDRDDPTAVAETAAILEDELGRMGRLVEDLMAIARSDMEDFVRPRQLDLVQWFEELELKLSVTGSTVRILPPPPVTLEADPDRLAQAVINLVGNAQAHTPPGTRIEVRATVAADAVTIVVADDGPGIPEELRAVVFEPFVRGDTPGSSGLGLAVVRAVVAAHGGRIDLVTGPDGTRFAVRLPWSSDELTVDLLAGTDDDVTAPPPALEAEVAPLEHPPGAGIDAPTFGPADTQPLRLEPERARSTIPIDPSTRGR